MKKQFFVSVFFLILTIAFSKNSPAQDEPVAEKPVVEEPITINPMDPTDEAFVFSHD